MENTAIPSYGHQKVETIRAFTIDPGTKEVCARTSNLTIAQRSKDSDRFVFTIPDVTAEGYDLTACNSVMIHFENISQDLAQRSIGIYKVKDLSVEEGSVTLSWLIDDEATLHAGGLIFSIHFSCTAEDGAVVYNFPTLTYSRVTIGGTVWNSDTIVKEHLDIIAKFDSRIAALEASGSATVRYDGPQELTPKEQAQVKANLGITEMEKVETVYLELEQGGITSATGGEVAGANRLRSYYVSITDVTKVASTNSDYNLYGHFYDADKSYVGNTGGWVSSFNMSEIIERLPTASYFRIVVRKNGDPEITPSDAVGIFEMTCKKTIIGAESVLYTPQSLTKYQQAQARANIGVVPTLIIDASGDTWSHTFSEIKAHVEAGGFAVLKNGYEYFPLMYFSEQRIQFAVLEEDGYLYIYELQNNDAAQARDIMLIRDEEYFPPLFVTVNTDTKKANRNYTQIKNWIDAGGTVIACVSTEGTAVQELYYLQYLNTESKVAIFINVLQQTGHDITVNRVTIDNAGACTLDYQRVTDGKTPVKGIDYFTEADKAEMVNAVIAALPVYAGEVV